MEGFYRIPYERFEKYSPYGDAEALAEYLRPYVDAGCRHLNITPCAPDPQTAVATAAEVKRLLGG